MATFQAANTSFQIPDGGEIFIPLRPQGIAPVVYIRSGNTVSYFPIMELTGNTGTYSDAIQKFNQQTGLDYYSLPQQNIADVEAAFGRGNQGSIQPLQSINQFLQVKQAAQPGGNIDISQGQTYSGGTLRDAQGNAIPMASTPSGTPDPQAVAMPNNGGAAPIFQTNQQQGQQTAGGNQVTLPNGAVVTLDAQGNIVSGNPAQGNTNVAASSGLGGSGGPDLSGLPPQFQQLYSQLEVYLEKLKQNGQVLNPNVDITPEKLQEFAAQAAREIDPYYANLLKTNVSDFMREVGYTSDQIFQREKQLEQKYATDVRQLGESAADKGFAQSGLRQRDERQLATDTQNTINQTRQDFGFKVGTAARSLAGEFGTANVPQFNMGVGPTVGAGESNFGRSSAELPLYSLSDSVYSGLKGTKEFEQEAAKRNRASQLEEAFRGTQSLNQARTLTM